jgi:hypothetical protein
MESLNVASGFVVQDAAEKPSTAESLATHEGRYQALLISDESGDFFEDRWADDGGNNLP